MRVFFATSYRVAYALAGLATAVVSALVDKKIVDWSPRIAATIAICVGLLACVDNLRLIKFKFDAKERSSARSRMHKPVVTALSSITKARSLVQLEDLGISVFDIKGRWVRKWFIVPWRERRLRRILRFRLSDYPPESDVIWTKGKGTIGECWAKGIRVLDSMRATARAFGDPSAATPATFAQLTEEERHGFNFDEFCQTVGKYGEILAMPIGANHSGEIIGVLSIDCGAGAAVYAGQPDDFCILEGADIEVFAQRAINLIRDDVGKF